MKIFIGQAVTGQDMNSLRKEIEGIYSALIFAGHKPYSTLNEKDDKFNKKGKWLFHAFQIIDKNDAFLAIVRSEHRSEGLLIEIGYTLSKNKKFILAINKDVKNTYLRDVADKVIEYKDFDDLIKQLKKLK